MRRIVGPGLLAIMVFVTACTSATDADAGATDTTPPGATRILVTGPEGRVSVVTPGGRTEVVVERSAPVFSIQPTPSPDGTMIAHTALDDDGAPVANVWTEGSVSRIDFGFTPFFFAWNADGSRLAALGNGESGVVGAIAEVGSGEVIGIGSGAPHFLAWSPNGQTLATHRDGTRIDLVGTDGTTQPVRQTPAVFQAPEWLSDDEVLVAVVGSSLEASTAQVTSGRARLVGISGDGSSRDIIEVDTISLFDLDTSRRRLAVFDGPPGDGRLRTIDLASGDITDVDAPNAVAFEWSPDGTRLLTFSFADGLLTPAVWDTDGVGIQFDPFTPTVTHVNEYLGFWGQYVRTVHSWSPNGTAFVFSARGPEEDAVFIQPIDGGAAERVAAGSMAQWLP